MSSPSLPKIECAVSTQAAVIERIGVFGTALHMKDRMKELAMPVFSVATDECRDIACNRFCTLSYNGELIVKQRRSRMSPSHAI